MKISEVDIEVVLKKILDAAEKKRLDAGMGGAWNDGGASELERQVEIFRCGMEEVIPQIWMEYAKEIRNAADPEWEKYQQLKKKFEGDE